MRKLGVDLGLALQAIDLKGLKPRLASAYYGSAESRALSKENSPDIFPNWEGLLVSTPTPPLLDLWNQWFSAKLANNLWGSVTYR
jgi:hypothetical protein